MRVLLVERDLTITELETDPAEWRGDDDWDAAKVDNAHYAWVKDDALFVPGVVVADIGEAKRMPLPAYVTGFEGERTIDARLSVDELRSILN